MEAPAAENCASTEPPNLGAVRHSTYSTDADRQGNTAPHAVTGLDDAGSRPCFVGDETSMPGGCDRHVFFCRRRGQRASVASFRRPGTLLLISDGIFLSTGFCLSESTCKP